MGSLATPIYKSLRGHATYFQNFGTLSISRKPLKLETSKLARSLTTRGAIERNAKLS